MQALRAHVCDSIDVLSILGHQDAVESTLTGLNALLSQLHAMARTITPVAKSSRAHHGLYKEKLKYLYDTAQLIANALRTPWGSPVAQTWTDIHSQLLERLGELGIVCSPQQLEELHVAGNPAHLVQVLFAAGRIAADTFVVQY